MADRYAQLVDLARRVRPRKIVEVGVHRAARAKLLCREALALSRAVHYVGYDVFETMDPSFHDAAMNGKGIPAEREARAALDAIARENPGRFTYELRIGDTRQTLHGKLVHADLAWIDGDHRVEAILGDYLALRACPVIALDDYIETGANGEGPDLGQYGANEVVRRIIEAGQARVTLLPARDLCRHGGYARIAVVER